MKKQKTNLLSKVNKSLFALVLISCCMISGTLAKYITTVSASDRARVAKFDVATSIDKEKSLLLFDTLLDTDGSPETDVKSLNKDKVIAPGTQGSFDVEINNKSEVSIDYELQIFCTNLKFIPIEFSVDKQNWKSVSVIKPLTVKNTILLGETTQETVTIYWRWEFERGKNSIEKGVNNAFDTVLGKAGVASTEVTILGTFTQVD